MHSVLREQLWNHLIGDRLGAVLSHQFNHFLPTFFLLRRIPFRLGIDEDESAKITGIFAGVREGDISAHRETRQDARERADPFEQRV